MPDVTIESLQHECSLLRDIVRRTEPDRAELDELRQILSEIGRLVGCNHMDTNLVRCVEEALAKKLEPPKANLQRLSDAGVNPFAVQLLYESVKDRISAPVGFEFRGFEFFIQPKAK